MKALSFQDNSDWNHWSFMHVQEINLQKFCNRNVIQMLFKQSMLPE